VAREKVVCVGTCWWLALDAQSKSTALVGVITRSPRHSAAKKKSLDWQRCTHRGRGTQMGRLDRLGRLDQLGLRGSAAGGARPSSSRSRSRSRSRSSSSGGGGGSGSGNTQQARQQRRTRRRGVATLPLTRPRFAERGGGARVWLLVETAWHRSRKRACHPGPGTCV
jgi:hypothetical protein